ncbi:hypothetical protein STENM223S_11004 [Streptomyces tendae]
MEEHSPTWTDGSWSPGTAPAIARCSTPSAGRSRTRSAGPSCPARSPASASGPAARRTRRPCTARRGGGARRCAYARRRGLRGGRRRRTAARLPRPAAGVAVRTEEPRVLRVRATDAADAVWTVRLSQEPPVTVRDAAGDAECEVSGPAAALYLAAVEPARPLPAVSGDARARGAVAGDVRGRLRRPGGGGVAVAGQPAARLFHCRAAVALGDLPAWTRAGGRRATGRAGRDHGRDRLRAVQRGLRGGGALRGRCGSGVCCSGCRPRCAAVLVRGRGWCWPRPLFARPHR